MIVAKGTEANLGVGGITVIRFCDFEPTTLIRTTGKLSTGLMYRLRKESFRALANLVVFPFFTTMQWAGWLSRIYFRHGPHCPVWLPLGQHLICFGVCQTGSMSIKYCPRLVPDWQPQV